MSGAIFSGGGIVVSLDLLMTTGQEVVSGGLGYAAAGASDGAPYGGAAIGSFQDDDALGGVFTSAVWVSANAGGAVFILEGAFAKDPLIDRWTTCTVLDDNDVPYEMLSVGSIYSYAGGEAKWQVTVPGALNLFWGVGTSRTVTFTTTRPFL